MEKKPLFDTPATVKRLLVLLFAGIGLSLLPDFFIHKHAYFAFEEWPGFYAIFAFVACGFLVLIAKYLLRPLIMRKEDYYGHR